MNIPTKKSQKLKFYLHRIDEEKHVLCFHNLYSNRILSDRLKSSKPIEINFRLSFVLFSMNNLEIEHIEEYYSSVDICFDYK